MAAVALTLTSEALGLHPVKRLKSRRSSMAAELDNAVDDRERVVASLRAGEAIYAAQGSPLYAALSRAGAEDPFTVELVGHAMRAAPPVHLFTSVHYLLLGGLADPLARYFPTLSSDPAPPDQAWTDFRRFCGEHHDELRRLLDTRPVQMTYVERCRTLLPPMCHIAEQTGEALNIIEIGCSAGVLLTFDRYAYELRETERVGPSDAPFVLEGRLTGGPRLFMPRIGRRIGIDLNIIDPGSEEDRRWMLATCFPELKAEQTRLAQAMAIVAETDIRWLEGDALELIGDAVAQMPDPLCVYHSACLFYWPEEAKATLDQRLRDLSQERRFYRIGIEPTDRFNNWQSGHGDADRASRPTGEITVTRYENGEVQGRVMALSSANFGSVWWQD
jgi:hypothetical protein